MGLQTTAWSKMLHASVAQIIVPEHLQESLIRWSHANYPYIHTSQKVTSEWITRRYWFYQHLTEKFNDLIHVDFLDVNVGTKKNENVPGHLLIMVDSKTGWMEAEPMKRKNEVAVVRGIDNGWVARWGVPMAIMTDHGDGFMSKAAQEFYERYRIHKMTSASNNPQSNGKAESSVKKIKWLLATAIQQFDDKTDWPEMIPVILLALRTTMKVSSGRPSPDLATLDGG